MTSFAYAQDTNKLCENRATPIKAKPIDNYNYNGIESNEKLNPEKGLDDDYWTIAAITDELIYQLSTTCDASINKKTGSIHITHKYSDWAESILHGMSFWSHPPVIIINHDDLTIKAVHL